VIGIGTEPAFAIGQRALLITTSAGNVLWDMITYLDDELIRTVRALGGVSAIAISHPHYYGTMIDWAHEFGAVVYIHTADSEWIPRPDPVVELWEGDTLRIGGAIGDDELIEAVDAGTLSGPLTLLGHVDDPVLQLRGARRYVAERYRADAAVWAGERYGHGRIRVAYLSGDLREHAVSRTLVGVWERHDRERFEVLGVSYRAAGASEFERRVERGFDRFIDVSGEGDEGVARRLRELEVDIAVDLMGFTQGLRLGILARRVARNSRISVRGSMLAGYAGWPGAGGCCQAPR